MFLALDITVRKRNTERGNAMESMWSGSISFGLVSVPVKMYVATKSHDTAFHQVHKEDLGRVRYIKRCEVCGRELRSSDIERAIEGHGTTVVVDQGDLDDLPTDAKNEIGIAAFVKAAEIDSVYLDRTYYLEPDEKGLKAYALLSRTLADTDRVALGTVRIRNRSHMVALTAVDNVIRLQQLHWPDEIRAPLFASLAQAPEISEKELDLARTLVDTLETAFDAEDFVDTYEQRLQGLIDEQRATLDEDEGVTPNAGGEVIDLLAALQRSVEAAPAKKSSQKQVTKAGSARKRPANKRQVAKGAAAKKVAKRASAVKQQKAG